MANEDQVAILRQGAKVWNKWRKENPDIKIDLRFAGLREANLREVKLHRANIEMADFYDADLMFADFRESNLERVTFIGADLTLANLEGAALQSVNFHSANLTDANLSHTDLSGSHLSAANFVRTNFTQANISRALVGSTVFGDIDLSQVKDIETIRHDEPSILGVETFYKSRGKIPEIFLRGCGLKDWEIESAKLYDPDLSNEEINRILYKMYDLRANQALQIFPLFISYSHGDGIFVDKLESHLNKKGVRFWRDVHDAKAGRLEKQVDRAMRLNPTVLLILSENSLKSDWVEHEVHTARGIEKEMGRDVLCPVALDDSWKTSPWPKRVMEQIMEYNILDFSSWEDDVKFDGMFRRLIDGLQLFYKG